MPKVLPVTGEMESCLSLFCSAGLLAVGFLFFKKPLMKILAVSLDFGDFGKDDRLGNRGKEG